MTQEIVEKIKKATDMLYECEKEVNNPRYKCGMLCYECEETFPHMYKECHVYRDISTGIYYSAAAYQSAKNLLEFEESRKG